MDRIFTAFWNDTLKTPGLRPVKQPQGFVLGGQPGAGKSMLTLDVCRRLNHNVLIINGDEHRRLHPEFDAIHAQYGIDGSKYTNEFSGKMTELVLAKALSEGFNIAIEGTFRTADVPLRTLKQMKDHGYTTHVLLMQTPVEESWQSVQDRYAEMQAIGMVARMTPKEHHDLVVNALADNVAIIKAAADCDHFEVISRPARVGLVA